MALCHTCQQVWVPVSAADWLAANAANIGGKAGQTGVASPLTATPPPSECANCGAPYEPDEAGRCRYCRAQISAPAPIVFTVEETTPSGRSGSGLLETLAALLTEPID
jgi:hypothetical protein